MSVKVKKSILAVMIFVFFVYNPFFFSLATDDEIEAEPGISVVGNRTTEDAVYIYIDGAGSIQSEDVAVQIGTEKCDNVKIVSADDIRIRTLFILDNSKSTAKNWGNDGDAALKLMSGIVDNHMPNEEFKIMTYATGVTELTSYTSDYLTLQSAIQGIKYENQDSYIKDTLYNILKELSDDNEDIFYRIVLIADGVENNQITYTDSEIESLIRMAGVPLYAIAVKAGNNTSQLEAMQSYSRISGAKSWMVSGRGDKDGVDQILADFSVENQIVGLQIVPPRAVQNGGRENSIKISISGVEKGLIVDNVRMPFASEPAPTQIQPTEKVIVVEKEVETPPVVEVVEEESWFTKNKVFLIIIVIAAVIVCAIISIIVWGKKKQESDAQNEFTYIPDSDDDKTVIVGSGNLGSGDTVGIWNQGSQITLTDIMDNGKVFHANISDSIVIGRKRPADIVLDFDQAVSSRHCMISKRGGQYYLKDLGSANKTFYNNELVESETPIEDGGIITIGRNKYRFMTG